MRENRICNYYTAILIAFCIGLLGCKSNTEKKSIKNQWADLYQTDN